MSTELAERLRSWTALTSQLPQAITRVIDRPPHHGVQPGTYPFTRGWKAAGYRDSLWVMGQYSGYASPRETRERFIKLLSAGQTGLSIALDLPTQLGLDSDAELAIGEVGRVGVPIDSVEDLLRLLDGVPFDRLRQLRTTANSIGPMFAAMLIVALEELGVDPGSFRMMLQNDPLKEFVARGTYIYAPQPSLKLAVDVVEYFSERLPHWEPIEFCGYHIRDAGATRVGEVAVMTANGIAYLDEAASRGVDIQELAPALHLFLSAGVEIFEEAAKLRTARALWAKILHEHYGVAEEACGVKIFSYTLGGALTAQEPLNNVVRVAYEALAAALGGVDTLATSSYDEALGLPSPPAAHLSLRTQQVLGFESGISRAPDPLGGSYHVEALTQELEQEIVALTAQILELGGAVAAIESGFVERLIAENAFELQLEVESGERPLVGVNVFADGTTPAAGVSAFRVPPEWQDEQVANLRRTREARDSDRVHAALGVISRSAAAGKNLMPALIEAARARATIGEITDAIATVHPRYRPSAASIWR